MERVVIVPVKVIRSCGLLLMHLVAIFDNVEIRFLEPVFLRTVPKE